MLQNVSEGYPIRDFVSNGTGGRLRELRKQFNYLTRKSFSLSTYSFLLNSSGVSLFNNLRSAEMTLSGEGGRNFILGSRQESSVFFTFNQFCSKMEHSFNRIDSERGVGFNYLVRGFSCLQKFQDKINHYASSFKTRLAMAYFRVNTDIIFDFHLSSSCIEKLYHSIDALSIEGVGNE